MRKINIEAERRFENLNVTGQGTRKKQEKFFWSIIPSLLKYNDYVYSKIKGKHVLEIGCSNGEMVKRYGNH